MVNLQNQRQGLLTRFKYQGAIAIVLLAALLGACEGQREAIVPDDAPRANVTTEEIAEDTAQTLGEVVTVRSQPVQVIAPSTFTIQDQEAFGTESILVVNATGTPFVLPTTDTEVQVTGTVRQFTVAEINRDYGLGLDPDLYVDYENRPAIIAQSLALAPEPSSIAATPDNYYDQTVAVPGEVGEILGPNTFNYTDSNLLVLTVNPEHVIAEGANVVSTGVVRPFNLADLEEDFGLDWTPEERQQLTAYQNRPVLVAQSVFASASPAAAN